MHSSDIDVTHTIARYLAGRLPAGEAEAFEQRVAEQPELRVGIEQTLRFREGLARLQERGELGALVGAPAARRWLPYAAAAAVLVAIVGALLWLQPRAPAVPVLARSVSALAADRGAPPSIVGSYVLARTRGGAAALDVPVPQTPGALELRIAPTLFSPKNNYAVTLARGAGPAAVSLARIDAGTASPDGYVTVYLDSRRLTAGDYELSLALLYPEGTRADSDRFVIRVK